MSDEENDQVSEVAMAILEYLRCHPTSADSKEGIVRWWVMERHLRQQIQIVEAELEALVKKGLVERSRIGGRDIYQAAKGNDSND